MPGRCVSSEWPPFRETRAAIEDLSGAEYTGDNGWADTYRWPLGLGGMGEIVYDDGSVDPL